MTCPEGPGIGKALAALVTLVTVLALFGVSAAAAASPTTKDPSYEPLCDGSTGTWTLHWLITNQDTKPIKVSVSLSDLVPRSSGTIPVGEPGHIYVTNAPNGYQGSGTMTVSWADGSEPHAGALNIASLGTCTKTQVTVPTIPGAANPPRATVPAVPGATTTAPAGSRPSLQDPTNPSPTSSVLAQTNAVDPGADPAAVVAGESTTTVEAITESSQDAVQLAASPAVGSGSSSSGAIWIVLGILAVAAAGGAVILVMTRRSPGSDEAGADER